MSMYRFGVLLPLSEINCRVIILWVVMFVAGLFAILSLTGCASGVDTSFAFSMHKSDGTRVSTTVLIPSTITATNLVIEYDITAGVLKYSAGYITRSNEGIAKIRADHDIQVLDKAGNVVGIITKAAVEGAIKGVIP